VRGRSNLQGLDLAIGSRAEDPADALRLAQRATAYLLIQLRRANRQIERLRAVADVAREGRREELERALAALKPDDLDCGRRGARHGRG